MNAKKFEIYIALRYKIGSNFPTAATFTTSGSGCTKFSLFYYKKNTFFFSFFPFTWGPL